MLGLTLLNKVIQHVKNIIGKNNLLGLLQIMNSEVIILMHMKTILNLKNVNKNNQIK